MNLEMNYHTDSWDISLLFCLNQSEAGGEAGVIH